MFLGLEDFFICWICEDVVKFVVWEVCCGNIYDGIIFDLLKYGCGLKGEVWDLYVSLLGFLVDL